MNTDQMTDDEMRVKIAEACGWSWVSPFNPRKPKNLLVSPERNAICHVWRDGSLGGGIPPDYLNSRDAMAESEKARFERSGHGEEFLRILTEICRDDFWNDKNWSPSIAHATARQRAIAFLRTI